jgi:ubiquinone/menaquinone biosynthesis C-methylase UbiE
MYSVYTRLREHLFRLLDAKFGIETERAMYFAAFIRSPVESLLDLGCGIGLLFNVIKNPNKFSLLIGVDLKKGRNNKYQHVVADAIRIPFKASTFSLVTAFSLIEHVPENERESLYKNVKRVIKKKGTLLIQLPNRYALIESHTFLPLFGFLPSRMHSFAYREEAYVSVPSLKALISSLKKNGFHVYDIEKYDAPFLPFGRFLEKIGFFKLFPMGYIFRAHASLHSNTKDKPKSQL